jgi:hypothetical protein
MQQKGLFYVALFNITDHGFPTFCPQRPQNEARRQNRVHGDLTTVYWKGTRQADTSAYMNMKLRNTFGINQAVIAMNSQVGCYHNMLVRYVNKYCTMAINYSKFTEL